MSDPTQGLQQPTEQSSATPPGPFPLEEREQIEGAALNGTWNPWQGPAKPGFWSGAGFSEDNPLGPLESMALKPLGQATAAGELLLAGAAHRVNAFGAQELANVPLVGPFMKDQEQRSAALEADAAQRVKALTPDPATTGTAVQTISGLVSGGYRAAVGTVLGGPVGGAALLGTTQGAMQYAQLREQGVKAGTAAESAGLTGVVSGVGALIPGGFGASLFSKIATGAAANVVLGVASRYADHQILEDAGYKDMADQERVWDGVGMVTDALLGGVFGGLAHLHAAAEAGRSNDGEPSALDAAGARDATLVTNLAMRDRAASPGAPVDPASAAAHQEALQTAVGQLARDEPVNLADVEWRDAAFVPRPEPETGDAQELFLNALKEGGFLEQQRNLEALERALNARLSGERPEPEGVQTPATGAVGAGTESPVRESDLAQYPLEPEARSDLAEAYGAAQHAKGGFDATLHDISEAIGTPHDPLTPALKSVPRAVEKVIADYGGDASQVKDLLRGTIVANSRDQAEQALTLARTRFGEPLNLRDSLTSDAAPVGADGYRDIKFNVKNGDHLAEVQINVPEMLEAKREAHPLYEQQRSIETEAATAGRRLTPTERARSEALLGQQRELYAAAWERFLTRERNAASESNVPLRPNDESGNGRPLGRSQAVQDLPGTRETGTPSTSANSVPGGNEVGRDISTTSGRSIAKGGVDPLADRATQAVQEHPELMIAGEDGQPVRAADALQQAQQAVSDAERDAPKAFTAAVNCFIRKGGG